MKVLQFILMMSAFGVASTSFAQQIVDSIPFIYEKGAILVDAKVNGKTCKLIFDNGAGYTMITEAFVKSSGMPFPSEKNRLGTIQAGSFQTQVELKINTQRSPYDCPSFSDGWMGYNLMQNKIWMIDYRREKIYLLAASPALDDAIAILPFRTSYNQLFIDVKINNGEKQRLKLDTGFSSIGTMPLMLGKQFLDADYNALDSLCYNSVCDKMICRKTTTVNVSFPNHYTIALNALVTTSPYLPVVGNAFFDDYKIVFDYKNNNLILLSNE
jgi:hypothetical protein